MSDQKDDKTVLEKAKELFNSIKADRLKNNFYGYLIISFLIFNFENIILILKSKDMIEMTLIYIQLQRDFAWNFFWKPLICGIAASFLMPIATAGYVVFTGVFDAIRTDSKGVGTTLWERVKVYNESRLSNAKRELVAQEARLTEAKNEYSMYKSTIEDLKTERNGLEEYLHKLATEYAVFNNNYSHRNMAVFLQRLEDADILKHFPDRVQLERCLNFCNNNPIPVSVNETDKSNIDINSSN
ncbi:hypothetical protein L8P40_20980 [Enterobacter kobei]|uniref:hypothetical protein n=1 Tax=Enterobacter kobei TaxID=208224 RepID=UPI0020063A83|nr:hypothetical protein [Enterobacter kobei]MCK7157784.1 hypothetical protein [Enterobacter kobei]MCK7243534.1 hypothetical protein [Enterobacter kobei]MCK7359524.1 hypothetical protein [Enterobacter roggenkampii]